MAVFYRTNAQSRVLEDVLVRQQVPYQVIGGPRFYERAEIKDAAYLSLINNPDDAVALMRIANRPRRGIGSTTVQRLVSHAEALGISLWTRLRIWRCRGRDGRRPCDPRLQDDRRVAHVGRLRARDRRARRGGPAEVGDDRGLRGGADDRGAGEDREPVGAGSVRLEFRARVTDPASPASSGGAAPVRPGHARERHRAGDPDDHPQRQGARKYRVVFLIGMEEGIFPHSRSIEDNEVEEERRLAYVGMTRDGAAHDDPRHRSLALRAA